MTDKPPTAKHLSRFPSSRWSASTARSVLAAQVSSGESLTAFARRHGVLPQRLFWWRKRLSDWCGESAAPLLVPAVTLPARHASAVGSAWPIGACVRTT